MEASLPDQLKDMGFSEDQARIGIKYSPDKTLEGIITWISDNPDFKEPMETESPQTGESKPVEGGEPKSDAPAQEGESISSLVDAAKAQELQAMGYSKVVAEKSLFMTQNKSVEFAMNWIEEHRDDEDFEEELRMVKQVEGPKISKEEAEQKARDLQKRVREAREKKDAEEALEREKSRIHSGKAIAEAKRAVEEQQQRIHMEQMKKEKEETERAKQQMLEQLERDKADRLGIKYVSKTVVEKPPEEKIQKAFDQMRIVYPNHSYPDVIKNCLSTIRKIMDNILKNPTEPKFQKINASNEAFKNRVGEIVGGIFILNEVGFKDVDGFLTLQNLNAPLFTKIIEKLDKEIAKFA
jgi:uncharacterized UBP type Zn finger protein